MLVSLSVHHLREEQLRPGAVHELADEGVLDECLVRQVLTHLLLHQERVLQLSRVPAGIECSTVTLWIFEQDIKLIFIPSTYIH